MKFVVLWLLDLYRDFISPVINSLSLNLFGTKHSCRYSPTCSEYMRRSIIRFGLVKGLTLGTRRLLSCHPFGRVK